MPRTPTTITALALLLALKLGTHPIAAVTDEAPNQTPPHILHILADDLGWAEVGWHADDTQTNGEVQTPNMDALVAQGIELDRHYMHKICSPSRCAIQTGRAPIHVNVQNVEPEVTNPDDPVGGYQGIPLNMSTVATKLKEGGGYATHFVGKWDIGMATPMHAPQARGYDSWLGYWHHANDYYTQVISSSGCDATDLWRVNATHNGPATELANGPSCSFRSQTPAEGERCVYEEALFVDEVVQIMTDHVATSSTEGGEGVEEQVQPLFMFYSMHLGTHSNSININININITVATLIWHSAHDTHHPFNNTSSRPTLTRLQPTFRSRPLRSTSMSSRSWTTLSVVRCARWFTTWTTPSDKWSMQPRILDCGITWW